MAIKLIVGLGNPGKDYQLHRHNVGFWVCDTLARLYAGHFKKESRFFGRVATINIADHSLYLLKPDTYMNDSGRAIQSIVKFYQINTEEILLAHDELDLEPGTVRIKFGGGHSGHNGLRDTIKALNSNNFYRIRFGIGHPGDKSKVSDFVLHPPSKSELKQLENAVTDTLQVIETIVKGNFDAAIKTLHTTM